MAKFEMMMPFILHCEEGIRKEHLLKSPEQIYALVGNKAHNDPNDSGGWTKAGVILGTYTAYRKKLGFPSTTVNDLRAMPYNHWRDILKTMFWDKFRADDIKTQMVAVACVDWAWGSGTKGVIGVQKVLGVTADGIVGPVTLNAINSYPNQYELFQKIQSARNNFHASIAKPGTRNSKFLRGWNRRVAMITWTGFNFDAK